MEEAAQEGPNTTAGVTCPAAVLARASPISGRAVSRIAVWWRDGQDAHSAESGRRAACSFVDSQFSTPHYPAPVSQSLPPLHSHSHAQCRSTSSSRLVRNLPVRQLAFTPCDRRACCYRPLLARHARLYASHVYQWHLNLSVPRSNQVERLRLHLGLPRLRSCDKGDGARRCDRADKAGPQEPQSGRRSQRELRGQSRQGHSTPPVSCTQRVALSFLRSSSRI